ncbi:MAG TPA: metal ABC transporter substrate-binding protein [Vicinamibacteria bacterium]
MLSFSVMRSGSRLAAAAIAAAALTHACARSGSNERFVAASVFPLYDIARRVGGDRLRVELILPPGRTTHYYDPSPKDVSRLAGASVVFAVGLGLDSWLVPIVRGAGGGQGRVFDLGPLVDPRLVSTAGGAPHDHEGAMDPHFWLDPVRMQRVTDVVTEACRGLDPEGAPGYTLRGEEVKASLRRLHEELVPRSERWRGRSIVTFHGSLFYFAERYGLEIAAVVEPVPGREPTGREIAGLVALVKQKNVAALLTEPQLDRRAAEVIARETGLPLVQVDPVGGLPGTSTYEDLLRQVAGALDRALPRVVPEAAP